jgi:hypothetical protein
MGQLDRGEAMIQVLPAIAVQHDPAIVPLLQIVDKGQGFRIVRPGQIVEHDTLCFVPRSSLAESGAGPETGLDRD